MSQVGLFGDDNALREQSGLAALRRLKDRCQACRKCALYRTRTNVVFGEGNPVSPDIAFVGEGPGENEDREGRPFIGKAGELLVRMITAMGYQREQLYICNVVNCRPPNNRKPEEDEVKACREFLVGQLEVVQPKSIVVLGATAASALLKTTKALKDLRGQWFEWEGIPLRVTYHPAYLLRNPHEKSKSWDDLQAVLQRVKMIHDHAKETP